MPGERPDHRELVAAAFADEMAEGAVDHQVLRRIHEGEADEWLDALDRTGLFDKHTLAVLEQRWRTDPRELFDSLLHGTDRVTERRWRQAWAALERSERRTELG